MFDSKSLKSEISKQIGKYVTKHSMISHESYIRPMVEKIAPHTILEIGTFRGVSAVLWASLCDTVITLDRTPQEISSIVWRTFGVDECIIPIQVSTDSIKERIVKALSFDFAFLDGDHSLEGVRRDFSYVKKCGVVLFHDFKPENGAYAACENKRYPESSEFISNLKPSPIIFGQLCSQMALWIEEGRVTTDVRMELKEIARECTE